MKPAIPNNIGKRRKIINIWGKTVWWLIEDEIARLQSTAKHKVICFQKIRHEKDNSIEFRFGYYMIGVKAGAKGRWVWGQYALLIPKGDLLTLLKEAKRRKWL